MKIDLGTNTLGLEIEKVEKYYGAKYVGEFPLIVGEDKFADQAVSVFWRPKALRTANNNEYFAITHVVKRPFGDSYGIIEASYITRYIFNGLSWGDKVMYSRHETDKRVHENGAFIEGGFSKRNWDKGAEVPATLVRLQVIDGVVTILEDKK